MMNLVWKNQNILPYRIVLNGSQVSHLSRKPEIAANEIILECQYHFLNIKYLMSA
jgi:hypothetical protein